MAKQSAGILVYRRSNAGLEVLIAHPGGPFWAKKNKSAWSFPKGEFSDNEDGLEAAKREFKEEIGQAAPDGQYISLGAVKPSNKIIHIWAVEGNLDVSTVHSNTFTLEWPPKSGVKQDFPEIDKAKWAKLDEASELLTANQQEFLPRLTKELNIELPAWPEQESLF